ncbi:hypothetical protein SAMN05216480_12317 [Pustulibacterium marinum]|uniref:Uncharacterized protein n=1 Tax=Pustulibacterium marinum TaxID=1224947 RepID=A0A1I7IVX9_9FLAO|nr:hypothetical protein [Pustulibacterium marinum]SFU77107.1 hypothetical protein SAMN05216480_12317 [Pustulibacterium marinum]
MKKLISIFLLLFSLSAIAQVVDNGGINTGTGFNIQSPTASDERTNQVDSASILSHPYSFKGLIAFAHLQNHVFAVDTTGAARALAYLDEVGTGGGTVDYDLSNYDNSTTQFISVGDDISDLMNDAGYLTSIPVTYVQSGDNISELTNDAGYITAADLPESSGIVQSTTTDFTVTDGRLAYNRYNATDVYYITPTDSKLLAPSQPNGYNQVTGVYMNGLLLNEYEDYYVNSETEIELLTKIPNTRNTITIKYTTLSN